jgi:hypothetical protein
MHKRISDHIRSNIVGYIALFLFAIGGSAYALDGPLPGQNQVGSEDIINQEVKAGDLAPDSVGSAKIVDRQVKNADLGLGASSSNTIADGGIQGIDVKNNTLTGTQIDEGTLSGVNADTLDGIDSVDVARGHSRVLHASDAPLLAGARSGDLIVVPGYGTVRFDCNSTGQIAVDYTNDTNHIQFVVEDQGNPNPTPYRLDSSDTTTQTAHGDADSVTYHVSNGLVETAVIMVAGQKYNDPDFPFQDFCALQATAVTSIPF